MQGGWEAELYWLNSMLRLCMRKGGGVPALCWLHCRLTLCKEGGEGLRRFLAGFKVG